MYVNAVGCGEGCSVSRTTQKHTLAASISQHLRLSGAYSPAPEGGSKESADPLQGNDKTPLRKLRLLPTRICVNVPCCVWSRHGGPGGVEAMFTCTLPHRQSCQRSMIRTEKYYSPEWPQDAASVSPHLTPPGHPPVSSQSRLPNTHSPGLCLHSVPCLQAHSPHSQLSLFCLGEDAPCSHPIHMVSLPPFLLLIPTGKSACFIFFSLTLWKESAWPVLPEARILTSRMAS